MHANYNLMENEDTQQFTTPTNQETPFLLHHSNNIHQVSSKWRSKKLKNRRMNKAARQVPKAILKLQDYKYRESALTKLSNFLLEKREEDPDNYYSTGHLLYNSCSTMTILLQELLTFLRMMGSGNPTERAFKRLRNVLTLFQLEERRGTNLSNASSYRSIFTYACWVEKAAVTQFCFFIDIASIPNFLVPLLMFKAPLEEFENVRVVALSVIGILCQTRDSDIIQWAVESNMVKVCRISVEIGNELSKLVGMHIIEAILQDESGLSYICDLKTNQVKELMATLYHLATFLLTKIYLLASCFMSFDAVFCYAITWGDMTLSERASLIPSQVALSIQSQRNSL